jgi:hypothetical protein
VSVVRSGRREKAYGVLRVGAVVWAAARAAERRRENAAVKNLIIGAGGCGRRRENVVGDQLGSALKNKQIIYIGRNVLAFHVIYYRLQQQ